MAAAFRDRGLEVQLYEKDGALLPRSAQVLVLLAFSGRRKHQSTVKAMMLFPRLKSIWVLPPAPTTMYCLPSTW